MPIPKSNLPPPNDAEMAARREIVDQIRGWAQKLLDGPETLAAVKRAGIGGDFTPEEETAVFDRTGLRNFYMDINVIQGTDYQVIAQALARRVAAGQFPSTEAPEAKDYVLASTFVGSLEFGHPFKSLYNRKSDLRIPLDLFIELGRELFASEEYKTWRKERDRRLTLKRVLDEDESDELYRPVRMKTVRMYRNRGHIIVPSYDALDLSFEQRGISFDDRDGVLKLARMRSTPIQELDQ